MGYRVWIPRSDQGRVAQAFGSGAIVSFLEKGPLANYCSYIGYEEIEDRPMSTGRSNKLTGQTGEYL